MRSVVHGNGANTRREYAVIGDSDDLVRSSLIIYCPIDPSMHGGRLPFAHMINRTSIIKQPEK